MGSLCGVIVWAPLCGAKNNWSILLFGKLGFPGAPEPILGPKTPLNEPQCTSCGPTRLQRWSFFSCDAMAMFYFLQRCDIDYFWTFPTIAIVAIIFPNHRDRLFCDVCIILSFFGGVLKVLGVFRTFWRFLGGFLRGFGGYGGFGVFWGFSGWTLPSLRLIF